MQALAAEVAATKVETEKESLTSREVKAASEVVVATEEAEVAITTIDSEETEMDNHSEVAVTEAAEATTITEEIEEAEAAITMAVIEASKTKRTHTEVADEEEANKIDLVGSDMKATLIQA